MVVMSDLKQVTIFTMRLASAIQGRAGMRLCPRAASIAGNWPGASG